MPKCDSGEITHPCLTQVPNLQAAAVMKPVVEIKRGAAIESLSRVQLFVTSCTAARQASLSITIPPSLLKLMSIESVMPSNHLILCCPLLLLPSIFPASGSFPMSQFFPSCGQSIGASASASALPMNIQSRFPLGWTDQIPLQSKGMR